MTFTMTTLTYIFLSFSFLASPLFAGEGDGGQSVLRRAVERTYEKSLYAKVKVGNGVIEIGSTSGKNVFSGEFIFQDHPPVVGYEIVGDEGRLRVKFTGKRTKDKRDINIDIDEDTDYNIDFDERYETECVLDFSDRLPLILKMDLGFVKGNMNLGGLRLQDFEISPALSKIDIDFDRPNPVRLEEMRIESGFGKLNISNLANANFSRFRFEAGAGSYRIDFSGELREDAEADLEIGVGRLRVLVPRKLGVRLKVEKTFLCTFDIDDVYKDDDYYYNDRWEDGLSRQLDIRIDSGIAKVTIEWVD